MVTLVKQPLESLTFAMEFGPNLQPTEAVLSVGAVTVTRLDGQANDLTTGSLTPSGTQGLVTVSGGTDGATYQFTMTVTTNAGNTRVGMGRLKVLAVLP